MPNDETLLDRELPAHLRLHFFVSEVTSLLSLLVKEQSEHLPPDLREVYWTAWNSVRQSKLPLLSEILEGGNWPELTDRLAEVGLTGAELDLKLLGYVSARNEIGQPPFRFRPLKRVLGWINTILGSLASFLPPAEALKEYKESVENILDETTE